MSSDDALQELKTALRRFAEVRQWQQFHSPKNLAMALSVEAAELLEHFQWLTEEESGALAQDKRVKVEEEMADVLLYLIRIADRLDVDLFDAARKKMRINERKYPAELVRGSSRKYTEYQKDK